MGRNWKNEIRGLWLNMGADQQYLKNHCQQHPSRSSRPQPGRDQHPNRTLDSLGSTLDTWTALWHSTPAEVRDTHPGDRMLESSRHQTQPMRSRLTPYSLPGEWNKWNSAPPGIRNFRRFILRFISSASGTATKLRCPKALGPNSWPRQRWPIHVKIDVIWVKLSSFIIIFYHFDHHLASLSTIWHHLPSCQFIKPGLVFQKISYYIVVFAGTHPSNHTSTSRCHSSTSYREVASWDMPIWKKKHSSTSEEMEK